MCREVEYEEIREVRKEQSICHGVRKIPRVIVREVPTVIEVKKVVEREKIVYIKTAEVQAQEALYNAKLERQRQCLNATMCALSPRCSTLQRSKDSERPISVLCLSFRSTGSTNGGWDRRGCIDQSLFLKIHPLVARP